MSSQKSFFRQSFETKGAFYIEEGGKRPAEMTYSKAGPKRIIIDHTEVSEALKGKNAGKLLVAAGVEYAMANGIKVLPLCSFAKEVIMRTPEFQYVL